MNTALMTWLSGYGLALPVVIFMTAAVMVFLSGSRLTRHADAIASASGLGHLWIGVLLLSASTSLPELVTDVYASALRAPNLGIGDIMGSSLSNMLFLALLDLLYARRRLLDHIRRDHIMIGALAIILTALAGAAIASHGWGRVGRVGTATLLIVLCFLIGMRAVRAEQPEAAPPEQLSLGSTGRTVLRRGLTGFALATAALALVSALLVLSAKALARTSGLDETFVGTFLVGLSTSLPEGVATVAAVRLGAVDLAVANIFGSNAFNMCIILPMDLASPTGPVLHQAAPETLLAAFLAITAIALGLLRILTPRGRSIGPWRPESVLLVSVYCAAIWLL